MIFGVGDKVVINAANTIWHGDKGKIVELFDNGQLLVRIGDYGEWLFPYWQLTVIS